MTGGGSGGHVTPLLPVAHELRDKRADIELMYIGQRNDRFAQVVADSQLFDKQVFILAGKFRRYHGHSLWSHLIDIRTLLLNARDLFLVLVGTMQAILALFSVRHGSVLFSKGGYVSVPVVLAARICGIPIVTHDSDVHPGLANRIASKWAAAHAVGMPTEHYRYESSKTKHVGVPVGSQFVYVTSSLQGKYKQELGIRSDQKIVFVAGGGLGARRLNEAVIAVAPSLLKQFPDIVIIMQAGAKNEDEVRRSVQSLEGALAARILVKGFITDQFRYSGAADVIIARNGATNQAEFAVQGKAVVMVPNPDLTGGQQLKNASVLEQLGAAVVVHESAIKSNTGALLDAVTGLLGDASRRKSLGKALHNLAMPEAASLTADIILSTYEKKAR